MSEIFANWIKKDNKVKVIGRALDPDELVGFVLECTKEHGPGNFELFGTAKLARLSADMRR